MGADYNSLFEYKGWHIVREIGSGSFGKVYEIEKEDFGSQYKAALKVISIPQSEQELSQAKQSIGKGEGSLEVYYESVASEIVKEFELMYKLKGFSNIVSYEGHEVRKHKNGIGWDIMIQMELLTPLEVYRKNYLMTRKDIIRLGIDICKALERCAKYEIVHRDIKPANIFVSEQGDFKLGDFGIARTIEAHDAVLELSQKGTVNYMAPEIFCGSQYDLRVDIYSLGIMLYRYLNQDTLPFYPLPPIEITYNDVENAKRQRFCGKTFPLPCEDNTQLADIVLKACRYRPEDRYQSPTEMRKHLEMVLRGEIISEFEESGSNDWSTDETVCFYDDDDKTEISPLAEKISGRTEDEIPIAEEKQEKRNLKPISLLFLIVGAVLIIIFTVRSVIIPGTGENEAVDKTIQQPTIEDSNYSIQTDSLSSELDILIQDHNFVSAYKLIQDAAENGENLDVEIQSFVKACQSEREDKRAVAAMNLLSEDVSSNELFYRDIVQWFYEHEKVELVRKILSDLRNHGAEGKNLADKISLEYTNINSNEEDEGK